MKEPEHEFVESHEEMEEILRGNGFGFLGLVDDDESYVVPLNYSYHDGGRILVHCAHVGKKIDILRKNPNVCFTVARQLEAIQRHEYRNPCHLDSDSVICRGTARIIEDLEERSVALNELNHFFRPDAEDVPMEQVEGCTVVEISVKEMTGRRERERERSLWRWRF